MILVIATVLAIDLYYGKEKFRLIDGSKLHASMSLTFSMHDSD